MIIIGFLLLIFLSSILLLIAFMPFKEKRNYSKKILSKIKDIPIKTNIIKSSNNIKRNYKGMM